MIATNDVKNSVCIAKKCRKSNFYSFQLKIKVKFAEKNAY